MLAVLEYYVNPDEEEACYKRMFDLLKREAISRRESPAIGKIVLKIVVDVPEEKVGTGHLIDSKMEA